VNGSITEKLKYPIHPTFHMVGWGRVGGTPSHTQTPKKTYTKLQMKRIDHETKHRENKRLLILSATVAMHMNLPLALHYLLLSKNIDVEGVIYGDLDYVYIVRNKMLLKIPTYMFKTNEH
jgi:hypothetical protein